MWVILYFISLSEGYFSSIIVVRVIFLFCLNLISVSAIRFGGFLSSRFSWIIEEVSSIC